VLSIFFLLHFYSVVHQFTEVSICGNILGPSFSLELNLENILAPSYSPKLVHSIPVRGRAYSAVYAETAEWVQRPSTIARRLKLTPDNIFGPSHSLELNLGK